MRFQDIYFRGGMPVFCILPVSLLLTFTAAPLQAAQWPGSPQPATPLGPEVWAGAPIQGDSPCVALLRRVCGEKQACAQEDACKEARQMLERETREQAASGRPDRMTTASGQCQDADGDRARYRSCAQ